MPSIEMEKWLWCNNYCKQQGLPALDPKSWKKANEAYAEHIEDLAMRESGCTWKDCPNGAKHIEKDRFGIPWAFLCEKHHQKLLDAINSGPKNLLQIWILAGGGAEKMTERTLKHLKDRR